jgi:hypothetical protein
VVVARGCRWDVLNGAAVVARRERTFDNPRALIIPFQTMPSLPMCVKAGFQHFSDKGQHPAYPNSPELISCLCVKQACSLFAAPTHQFIRTLARDASLAYSPFQHINCPKCCSRSARNTRYESSTDTSRQDLHPLNTNPINFCFQPWPTNSFLRWLPGTSQEAIAKRCTQFWALWHRRP